MEKPLMGSQDSYRLLASEETELIGEWVGAGARPDVWCETTSRIYWLCNQMQAIHTGNDHSDPTLYCDPRDGRLWRLAGLKVLTGFGGAARTVVPALVQSYASGGTAVREEVLTVLAAIQAEGDLLTAVISLAVRGYEPDKLMGAAFDLVSGRPAEDSVVGLLATALRESDGGICRAALLGLHSLAGKAASAA
jgi:hypothetical protein